MTTTSGGITLEYLLYVGLLSSSIGGFVSLGKHLESLDKKGQRNSTISTGELEANQDENEDVKVL